MSELPLRLLVIEDSDDDAQLIVHELRHGAYQVEWQRVDSAAALTAALQHGTWDAITCDWIMPQFTALAALTLLREHGVDVPTIIVSGEVGEEAAVTAMKAGAHDFVSKHRLARLCPAMARELRETEVRRAHRAAQAALSASEERYRDLVEHSHDLLCTHDLDGRILSINPAPAKALGYEPAEIVGMNLRDILAPEARERLPAYLEAIREHGIATGLMTVLTRTGKRRVWEYTNTLRTEGVAAPIVRGVAHDITERLRAEAVLAAKEHHFRSLVENALDLVSIVEPNGMLRYVSPSHERALGFSVAELTDTSAFDFIHPDDLAGVQRLLVEDLRTPGTTAVLDYRFRRKDGSWAVIEAVAKNLLDDPIVAGVLINSRDISARAHDQDALRGFAAQQSGILDALPANIALLDATGVILAVNRAWRRFAADNGFRRADDGVGSNYIDVCERAADGDAGEARATAAGIRAVLAGRAADFSLEYPCHSADEQRWVRLMAAPLAPGGHEGAVVMHIDVTERVRAERALRDREDHFRALVEHAFEGITLVAADGTILYTSPSNRGLLGREPRDVVGRQIADDVHPDDLARVRAWFADVLAHPGKAIAGEVRRRHADGSWRWIEASTCNLLDHPAVRAITVNYRDITERKLAEDAVRRLNAELEARVRERTTQLEAANRELEAFSSSVSHDLRAPLRAIAGFSQILLEDHAVALDAEGRGYLDRIVAGTQRMGDLIRDLLHLSRVTRQEMSPEEVDLSAQAEDITAALRRNDPERCVDVVIARGLHARGDGPLCRLALENLLGNAWKYTSRHAAARIEFGVTERNGRRVYFVRDDGAGFDMACAGRLFDAFQRLHSASEFEGTGIGLATVQRVVQRHGGCIWAESAVEHGATFYFTLGAAPP